MKKSQNTYEAVVVQVEKEKKFENCPKDPMGITAW